MLALSIRQPWAELILRGIKTVEFRSRRTNIIGERFWIYASKGKGSGVRGEGSAIERRKLWSRDLALPTEPPKEWMIELCEKLILDKLPTGVIVGSAIVERVTDSDVHGYCWHLADVRRETPRKPTRHPQPVWFRPFPENPPLSGGP